MHACMHVRHMPCANYNRQWHLECGVLGKPQVPNGFLAKIYKSFVALLQGREGGGGRSDSHAGVQFRAGLVSGIWLLLGCLQVLRRCLVVLGRRSLVERGCQSLGERGRQSLGERGRRSLGERGRRSLVIQRHLRVQRRCRVVLRKSLARLNVMVLRCLVVVG